MFSDKNLGKTGYTIVDETSIVITPKKAFIEVFLGDDDRFRWHLRNQNSQIEAVCKPKGFGSLKGATLRRNASSHW